MKKSVDNLWLVVLIAVFLLLQTFEPEMSYLCRDPWISLVVCLMCAVGFVVLYLTGPERRRGERRRSPVTFHPCAVCSDGHHDGMHNRLLSGVRVFGRLLGPIRSSRLS